MLYTETAAWGTAILPMWLQLLSPHAVFLLAHPMSSSHLPPAHKSSSRGMQSLNLTTTALKLMHCSTDVAGNGWQCFLPYAFVERVEMIVLAGVDSIIITKFMFTVVITAVCLSEMMAKGYKVRVQGYIPRLQKVVQSHKVRLLRLQGYQE